MAPFSLGMGAMARVTGALIIRNALERFMAILAITVDALNQD
jgi:hypothetical protein